MKGIIILIGMGLLLVTSSLGAEIHGTVYGPSLNKIQNVVVEIDSLPSQRLVAKGGEYDFTVKAGRNYTIKAVQSGSIIAKEEIAVPEEGVFVFDVFAFPDLTPDESLAKGIDEEIGIDEKKESSSVVPVILGIVIVVGIILASVYWKRQERKEVKLERKEEFPEDELEKIITILKRAGGRMNQKELRKYFSLSEAKVSLMVSELEAKGRIEKIKKGRGNILILKEDF